MRHSPFDRVLAAQRQVTRAAEMKLHDISRRQQQVRTAQAEVIAALNDRDDLRGALARVMARRLVRLGTDAGELADSHRRQSGILLDEARRLKGAERLAAAEEGRRRREDEKRRLDEILDAIAGRAGESSR